MHVSSYLEAFLSVYGWMMYNTLYDLLGMTWLIFLPFMKLGITTFIDPWLTPATAMLNSRRD